MNNTNNFTELMNDGRTFIDTKWSGSTFEKIKTSGTTQKGTLGEDFLIKILNDLNISGETYKNENGEAVRKGPWDVSGTKNSIKIKFENKLATEDTNGGFQFNGLLPNKDWDYAFCLGVSPNEIGFQIVSRADIIKYSTLSNGKKRKSMDSGDGIKYSVVKEKLENINNLQNKIKEIYECLEKSKKQ